MLMGMGVLSRIDRNAIVRYCTDWSRWKRLQQFLAKNGECYPIKDGNGNIKSLAPFPQATTANKLSVLLAKFEQEFGMTPSARTRIECNVDDPASLTIEDYLKSRLFAEKYHGEPANGMSAEEALNILKKSQPLPVLKIDRRGEPGVGKPDDESDLD